LGLGLVVGGVAVAVVNAIIVGVYIGVGGGIGIGIQIGIGIDPLSPVPSLISPRVNTHHLVARFRDYHITQVLTVQLQLLVGIGRRGIIGRGVVGDDVGIRDRGVLERVR